MVFSYIKAIQTVLWLEYWVRNSSPKHINTAILAFIFLKTLLSIKPTYFSRFCKSTILQSIGFKYYGVFTKNRFDSSRIVPTEFDYYFRSQLLQGDVHDMGAAMLGGVGGHAGLFSNANDLGILCKCYFKMDIMEENAISKTILLINLLNVSFARTKTEEVLVLIKPF